MTGRLLLSNTNILESSIRMILPNNRCSARSWNYARCSSESALGPNSGLSNRDPESARLEIAALCGDYLCAASIVWPMSAASQALTMVFQQLANIGLRF